MSLNPSVVIINTSYQLPPILQLICLTIALRTNIIHSEIYTAHLKNCIVGTKNGKYLISIKKSLCSVHSDLPNELTS